VVEEELDELERLISNVLTATKLDLAALPFRRAPVRVRDLAEKSRDRVLALEPERQVELDVPQWLVANLDSALIARALDNLVDNARKYDESGRPIRISAHSDGAMMRMAVRDSGPGIPEQELARIFDPFYRGANARAISGGFGLGLALARRVVELHGGTIRATNLPQGGTEIELAVPCASAAASSAAASA
jgi:K+-sensing histidine kinase KdpD